MNLARFRHGLALLVFALATGPSTRVTLDAQGAEQARQPQSAQGLQGPLSMAEYRSQLDLLTTVLGATERPLPQGDRIVSDLPPVWFVQTDQRIFRVPTSALTSDWERWRTRGDQTAHARLMSRLRALGAEAGGFERRLEDRTAQRARLTDILSRPEFSDVHGPTWVDRLRQRVLELLARLLGRMLQSSAIPTVTNALVYAVVALAVIVLAWWMLGLIRREAAVETAPPDLLPDRPREWPLWLADAQAAAASGRWREGIHFVYWCAVSFVESTGAWRHDRARTPREYLGLVSASSEPGRTLVALTRRFELVWYGTEPADSQAYDEAIASLKKLGCPST